MQINTEHEQTTNGRSLRFPVRQFLTLSIPVAVVIIAIAFVFADMRTHSQLDQIIATERTNLRQISGYMAAETSSSLDHLLALVHEPALEQAMELPSPRTLQTLQSVLMTMASRNPDYQQIRWIDEEGTERVRITRDQGRLFVVDERNLQDKSNRYYFKSAKSLLVGEVYLSRLDMNMENGEIEIPVRPTLRVATPVQDSHGRRHGILIINISMRYMLAAIRSAHESNTDSDYILINQDGDWLNAPLQSDSAVSQTDPGYKFSRQHPAAWKQISTDPAGSVELNDGFWIWETLAPEDTVRRVVFAGSGSGLDVPSIYSDDLSLILVAYKPIQSIHELRQDARVVVVLGAVLLLGFYAWGLLFFLRGQLMEQQAELNITFARARTDQMERLKELEERFRLLVEASSVGMVVVDAEGVILMSNPAAESMMGYDKNALNGLSVDSLLPTAQRDQHAHMRAEFLLNPEVRMMGKGRKLEALTADGRRVPVEVGLNPFMDHGKQVVLASIIDLSQQ